MALIETLRWTAIGGLFLLPFVPLIISNEMVFSTVTGKNFAFRIVVELLAGVYLLLALREPKYRPRFTGLFTTAVALVAWTGIATLFSVDPVRSFWGNFERMEGYIGTLHLFAYFVVAACVLSAEGLWSRFFEAAIIASAVMATYCGFQILGLAPDDAGWSFTGTLGNPAYLGLYLQFNIFIAAFLLTSPSQHLLHTGSLRRVALCFLALFVGLLITLALAASYSTSLLFQAMPFIAVVLTGTLLAWRTDRTYFTAFILLALVLQVILLLLTAQRAPLHGTVAGFFIATIYAWLTTRGTQPWQRLRRSLSLRIAPFAVLGAVLFVLSLLQLSSVPLLGRIVSISGYYDTLALRLTLWRIAWRGFLDRPVVGYGPDNFDFVFNKYYDSALYAHEPWFDKAHNLFLDWLVAGGLPALVLVIAFLVLVAWAFARTSQISVQQRAVMLGLLAAYTFHSMFVFDNLASAIYFFGVAGLAYGLSHPASGAWLLPQRRASNRLLALATPIIGAMTLGACYLLNAPGIANAVGLLNAMTTTDPATGAHKDIDTNRQQFEAVLAGGMLGRQEATEQLLKFATTVTSRPFSTIDVAKREALYKTAHDAATRLIERHPNNAQLEFAFGEFLNRFGQNQEAAHHLTRASQLSPNKQMILIELGVTYLRMNDNADALPVLRKAFELDPRHAEARIHYAVSLYSDGQHQRADQLLIEGFGTTTPADKETLLRAYNSLGYADRAEEIMRKRSAEKP